ncbi:MAG: DUF4160 domain-containing protein [Paludibacteraceae bacterium]
MLVKKQQSQLHEGEIQLSPKIDIEECLRNGGITADDYRKKHLKESPNQSKGLVVEISRINTKDNGQLFPYNAWEIKIWRDDHNPPHFHIIKNGWNVSFYIENGEVYQIETQGKDDKIYTYMITNVKEWLQNECAILPKVTNQQNAKAQWEQIHG